MNFEGMVECSKWMLIISGIVCMLSIISCYVYLKLKEKDETN